MGDAGEGLVDAESRAQERMEELVRERSARRVEGVRDVKAYQALESLRLASTELARQLANTAHEHRRAVIVQALAEIEARIAALAANAA